LGENAPEPVGTKKGKNRGCQIPQVEKKDKYFRPLF